MTQKPSIDKFKYVLISLIDRIRVIVFYACRVTSDVDEGE